MSDPAASNAVLCAGRLYCDLVFTGAPNVPSMGTETFSKDLSLHAGGGAFITAAAFSALGWKASILATLPSAPFDVIVNRDIAEFDVDTSLCAKAPQGAAPQITVAISGEDDRAFLSHKTGAAVPDIVLSRGTFRHLHIGELRSLTEHVDLIEKAKQLDMTISLDCGWDEELLEQGGELAQIVSQVDVFLPNETEYDLLTQSGLPKHNAGLIVVKCGKNGAQALDQDEWLNVPTEPVKVVDATGAGDAFNGGFLSGWLSGQSLRECLEYGNRCGRFSVQKTGGTGGLRGLRHKVLGPNSNAAQ